MMEAAPVRGYRTTIQGTDDPDQVLEADIVIITAGSVRKPGMDRDALYQANKDIIIDYAQKSPGQTSGSLLSLNRWTCLPPCSPGTPLCPTTASWAWEASWMPSGCGSSLHTNWAYPWKTWQPRSWEDTAMT